MFYMNIDWIDKQVDQICQEELEKENWKFPENIYPQSEELSEEHRQTNLEQEIQPSNLKIKQSVLNKKERNLQRDDYVHKDDCSELVRSFKGKHYLRRNKADLASSLKIEKLNPEDLNEQLRFANSLDGINFKENGNNTNKDNDEKIIWFYQKKHQYKSSLEMEANENYNMESIKEEGISNENLTSSKEGGQRTSNIELETHLTNSKYYNNKSKKLLEVYPKRLSLRSNLSEIKDKKGNLFSIKSHLKNRQRKKQTHKDNLRKMLSQSMSHIPINNHKGRKFEKNANQILRLRYSSNQKKISKETSNDKIDSVEKIITPSKKVDMKMRKIFKVYSGKVTPKICSKWDNLGRVSKNNISKEDSKEERNSFNPHKQFMLGLNMEGGKNLKRNKLGYWIRKSKNGYKELKGKDFNCLDKIRKLSQREVRRKRDVKNFIDKKVSEY